MTGQRVRSITADARRAKRAILNNGVSLGQAKAREDDHIHGMHYRREKYEHECWLCHLLAERVSRACDVRT